MYNSDISLFALTKVLYNSDTPASTGRTARHGALLTECIQYGLDRGELASGHTAEEIENFLMVCIRGLVYDWCICDGGYDLKEKMKMYVDALLMPFCTDPRQ